TFFDKKGIPQPRLEAEILLAHVLAFERIDLYTRYDLPVAEEARTRFRDLVRRRAERVPTRYLTGACEFMSLALKVTPDCLIPRPETELLVETALRLAGVTRPGSSGSPRPGGRPAIPGSAAPSTSLAAIDLCTGCGCVAVSLAVYLPACRITATDLSAAAIEVARTNAASHGVADRLTFLEGDLYAPLQAAAVPPADFLLANPPYVAEADWNDLALEIRGHEPRSALVAGPRGTEIIERILRGAPAYLRPGGTLLVEIAAGQGTAVSEIARAVPGLGPPEILKDYAGLERILLARKEAAG
ncbi:MAG TPA: peptide chain release factor N(5)-glutamine methyltransferase, partial [Phycisphaerae bacterium]|nr:peptide chain release factor N(5)-glutamine methyltransferase [Phycisphaerae bacterium]